MQNASKCCCFPLFILLHCSTSGCLPPWPQLVLMLKCHPSVPVATPCSKQTVSPQSTPTNCFSFCFLDSWATHPQAHSPLSSRFLVHVLSRFRDKKTNTQTKTRADKCYSTGDKATPQVTSPHHHEISSSCISSTIHRVILLHSTLHQTNSDWFNEPSAVSVLCPPILRHAWLNL